MSIECAGQSVQTRRSSLIAVDQSVSDAVPASWGGGRSAQLMTGIIPSRHLALHMLNAFRFYRVDRTRCLLAARISFVTPLTALAPETTDVSPQRKPAPGQKTPLRKKISHGNESCHAQATLLSHVRVIVFGYLYEHLLIKSLSVQGQTVVSWWIA